MLAGTIFGHFADIEFALAQLGRDPNPMEIWEVACAIGAHRPDRPFGPISDPRAVSSDLVAEMIADEKAARAGNRKAQWAGPTEADEAAAATLVRGIRG